MSDQIRTVLIDQTMVDALLSIQAGVFDHPIDPEEAAAFLNDPHHHLILAYAGTDAVGMVTANVLLHPDKEPAMFINEVGVHADWRKRGIGKQLVAAMIAHAREIECDGIWLGTETDNIAARALYRSLDAQEMTIIGYAWDGAFDED